MRSLDVIERETNACLQGPWSVERSSNVTRVLDADGMIVCSGPSPATLSEPDHEATFIAAARIDVPDLVAEVRRLRESLVAVVKANAGISAAFDRCLHMESIARNALRGES